MAIDPELYSRLMNPPLATGYSETVIDCDFLPLW
ncbi:hypothetical protein ACVWZ4_001182 [Bradyrhizobium sp. USDA 4472]